MCAAETHWLSPMLCIKVIHQLRCPPAKRAPLPKGRGTPPPRNPHPGLSPRSCPGCVLCWSVEWTPRSPHPSRCQSPPSKPPLQPWRMNCSFSISPMTVPLCHILPAVSLFLKVELGKLMYIQTRTNLPQWRFPFITSIQLFSSSRTWMRSAMDLGK